MTRRLTLTVVHGTITAAALLVALVLLGLILPDRLSWGFNFAAYLAAAPRAALLILTVVLVILFSATGLPILVGDLWTKTIGRLPKWLGYVLAGGGLLALFVLFRSRAQFYGDGLSIVASLSSPNPPPFSHQQLVQPLSSYGFYYLNQLAQRFGPVAPSVVMAVANSLAGVFGVFALWRIANLLDRDGRERWFRFAASITSGAVILFFGYIEVYTIPISIALWSLVYTLHYARTNRGIIGALVFGLLACSFHLLMLPFLVLGPIAVLFKRRADSRAVNLWSRVLVAAIVLGGPLVSIAWYLTQTYPVFVPAFPGGTNAYWVLSPAHLNDLLQLVLQVAPLGLILYLLSLINTPSRIVQPEHRLLFLLALMTATISIWIDPLIGMARDWDLLSVCAFPLTLYGLNRFLLAAPPAASYRRATALAIVLAALVLVPQIAEKRNPDTALDRLDPILWSDAHYQVDFDKAFRCVSWGWLIQEQSAHPERSLKFFHRRIEADSSAANCWHYIGVYYRGVEQYDSVAFYFRGAVARDPFNTSYLSDLAILELRRNNLPPARRAIEYALHLEPEKPLLLVTASAIASAEGNLPEAAAYLERVLPVAPDKTAVLQRRLADLYLQMNQPARAHAALMAVYRTGPPDRKLLEQLCTLELQMGDTTLATEHCHELTGRFPDSPVVPICEKMLGR